MLSDWELWACANHVLRAHGDKAPLHVAEQIGLSHLLATRQAFGHGRLSPSELSS